MPRKKTKNRSFIKQRKAIATRLIQISLVMDDYVYKHKEIPECDASSYILEISSLKRKCNGDPRSLQVIEKLTHCMKTIVNEHRKRRENVPCELNNKAVITKVDYGCGTLSKMNIDKKYFTEENNAVPMEVNVCSDVDSCNENNDKLYQETYKNPQNSIGNEIVSDLIVVSSEDEATCCPENVLNDQNNLSQDLFYPHTQDENHNYGVSNSQGTPFTDLTDGNQQLQNSYAETSNYTQMDCSQSILSEHDFIENGDSLNLSTQIENTPASESTCPRNNIENDFAITLLPKDKVDYPNTHKLNLEHQALVNSTTNKMSDLQFDHFDVQFNAVLNPTANIIDNGKGESSKAKKAPRKKKVSTNSQESEKNNKVQRKPRKERNVSKPKKVKFNNISSTNNENSMDLSWMENIKYVREISVAENHTRTKDLSHNFWENYSLPIDWDDSEFEYHMITKART